MIYILIPSKILIKMKAELFGLDLIYENNLAKLTYIAYKRRIKFLSPYAETKLKDHMLVKIFLNSIKNYKS